ncbi:MAG: CHAT domain-containing protein [candidate division NC10 bacterium]|nr:CHAT domain-containing protein [candidate division NC10 bacterium]
MKQVGVPAIGASTPQCPRGPSPPTSSGSSAHHMLPLFGRLCLLLILAGCATTDEQRFPLRHASGHEAAYQIESTREARAIAELFPVSVLLTRQDATKSRNRDQGRRTRLLQFATHAELEETDPLGSALLLTPANGDDGRLVVQEIFGLDLHASLVVLSACETALGKPTRGDELTGLTRAFIYAGTPSIITTLWQVNDRGAFELMREFYHHLKAGQDKAESLRQAQLAMLARRLHPYYWAAYQLIGEAR